MHSHQNIAQQLAAPARQEMKDNTAVKVSDKIMGCDAVTSCIGDSTLIGGTAVAAATVVAPILYVAGSSCNQSSLAPAAYMGAYIVGVAPCFVGSIVGGMLGLFATPCIASCGEPEFIKDASNSIKRAAARIL
jgi:hypothetical protein